MVTNRMISKYKSRYDHTKYKILYVENLVYHFKSESIKQNLITLIYHIDLKTQKEHFSFHS